MNNLGPILLILICVGIGYVIEPIIIADKDSPREPSESETSAGDEGNATELTKEEVTPSVEEVAPTEPVVASPEEEAIPIETEEFVEKVEESSAEVEEIVTPPVVTPEPVSEPEITPEPVVEEAGESIVDVMKASVKEEEVTEFKFSDVISWKEGESFEFEGESYVTGVVTFKAETILGVQENDAIALIKDGAVYKWLWEKTKLEMR